MTLGQNVIYRGINFCGIFLYISTEQTERTNIQFKIDIRSNEADWLSSIIHGGLCVRSVS